MSNYSIFDIVFVSSIVQVDTCRPSNCVSVDVNPSYFNTEYGKDSNLAVLRIVLVLHGQRDGKFPFPGKAESGMLAVHVVQDQEVTLLQLETHGDLSTRIKSHNLVYISR